jgi:hypothetical protein
VVDGGCEDKGAHDNQEEGRTTGDPGQTGMTKKGPRDVVDVSWAPGKFFLFSFHFFVTNKLF